jgi:hypothetical protein
MKYYEIPEDVLEKEKHRNELYDYYGIPYGIFCGGITPADIRKQDREKAERYIRKKKPIPSELQERLLLHKKNEEIEKDRLEAKMLILQNKPIPREIEERLFSYKKSGT